MSTQEYDSFPFDESRFPIVLFDGVCNLCNASVDFVIRRDKRGIFRFASNERPGVQEFLARQLNGTRGHAESTVYLYQNGELYDRSTAVLRIAKQLPWPWPLLYIGVVFPAPIRNLLYRLIAKNRYQWFGRQEVCRLPSEDERSRFL